MAFQDKDVKDLKRGDYLTAKWLNSAKNAKTNIIGAGLVQVSTTSMGTVVRVDEPKGAIRWGVVKDDAISADYVSQYININPCDVRINSDGDYEILNTNTNITYKMYLEINPSDLLVDSDNTDGIAAYPYTAGELVPMLYTGTSEAVLYGNTITEIVGRVIDSDLGSGKHKFFKTIPTGNSSSLTLTDTTVSDYAWELNSITEANNSDLIDIIHKVKTQGSDVYIFNKNSNGFIWAEITGSSQIAGYNNRWLYAGKEVEPVKEGRYTTKASGWSGNMYNTFEANNAASGIQGSGDNVSYFPVGVALQPIGVGAVVQVWKVINCEYDVEYHFTSPNNPGGECT